MAKKAIEDVVEEIVEKIVPTIYPLEQEFGNGDLNILKDKLNEIIKFIR